jgi:hypothetical protein
MARECFGPLSICAHTIDNGQCPSSLDPPPDENSPSFETHVTNDLYSQAIDDFDLMAISSLDTIDACDFLPQATNFYCYLSW